MSLLLRHAIDEPGLIFNNPRTRLRFIDIFHPGNRDKSDIVV